MTPKYEGSIEAGIKSMESLERDFEKRFGRSLGSCAEQEILNEGNPDCNHPRIYYENIPFDGQSWQCDVCPRHERMAYSPGFIMKFPKESLMSTPNPENGGECFYAFTVDKRGEAKTLLVKLDGVVLSDNRVKREV